MGSRVGKGQSAMIASGGLRVSGSVASVGVLHASDSCAILFFFSDVDISFFRFFLDMLRPARFRKLREACRIHFHVVAPLKKLVVTSYDQKNKQVNDQKSNDYFNVSVCLVFLSQACFILS